MLKAIYTKEEVETMLRHTDEVIETLKQNLRRGITVKPSVWEEHRNRQQIFINALADWK